jgi:ABC-type multidrug transport system ATPase subunit/ABC-type multidrug transport system permease subunit
VNAQPSAVHIKGVRKSFRRETGETVQALDDVSLDIGKGQLTALVGPDGGGKTTLIRLIAGLMVADAGELLVLGINVASDPLLVQSKVAYMPQQFGLYEDLTVQENLDLYADLHGIPSSDRKGRFASLMEMTALGAFTGRLAGKLSGGMKQKLGLACTLVSSPELLLLDEPTVGVDPLSRRELWEIIRQKVKEGLTVLLSTSYLDEAAWCEQVLVLNEGKTLALGRPESVNSQAAGLTFLATPRKGTRPRDLQSHLLGEPTIIDAVPEGGKVRFVRSEARRPGEPLEKALGGAAVEAVPACFEDGFMVLLKRSAGQTRAPVKAPEEDEPASNPDPAVVVGVRDLVRRFGKFTAVDHISFDVRRGEIFGLLGPNGAGKTTTFRMLCGLLPPSSGTLTVAGINVRDAPASARQHLGYVAQKFSLYGQLSVTDNLEFFASAYGLEGARKRERIAQAMTQFELSAMARLASGQLPGGYKQRLAMAAALLHEPEILFLDEPTSGADPLARREFWQRITALSAHGVTVIVTTHFMEEAEYCDRAVILDDGKMLAEGTPDQIRARGHSEGRAPNMEDAFIAIVTEARGPAQVTPGPTENPVVAAQGAARISRGSGFRRIWALTLKEVRQIIRDPSSVAIGIVLPVMLILLFGYGLSLDVKSVPLAVVQQDSSLEAAGLTESFRLSEYFKVTMSRSTVAALQLMAGRKVEGIVTIPTNFARRWRAGDGQLQLLVNGTDANNARIIEGYVQGPVGQWEAAAAGRGSGGQVNVMERVWFNASHDSHYFLVPGLIVLVMTIIGAFLTAVVVAREWERGTFEALFVTPVRVGEILASKILPYFALGMIGFALCLLASKFLFHVPLRGSFPMLCAASMLYLLVALGIGLLVSIVVKTQFLASQLATLLTFLPAMMLSGFLYDLRSMPVAVRAITYILPARYAVALLQTLFLAGNVWGVILPSVAVLAIMAAGLLTLARLSLRKTIT